MSPCSASIFAFETFVQPSWMDLGATAFKGYDMEKAYAKMVDPRENFGNKAIDGNGLQRLGAFNEVLPSLSPAPLCIHCTGLYSGSSRTTSPKTPSSSAVIRCGSCPFSENFFRVTSRLVCFFGFSQAAFDECMVASSKAEEDGKRGLCEVCH